MAQCNQGLGVGSRFQNKLQRNKWGIRIKPLPFPTEQTYFAMHQEKNLAIELLSLIWI